MKLLVPYCSELDPVDNRLCSLASFLGVVTEAIPLLTQGLSILEKASAEQQSCLVVHPRVMEAWLDQDALRTEFLSDLLSRFQYLLVHAVRPLQFDSNLIADLSVGQLCRVAQIGEPASSYEIAANTHDVCGPFAGLTFGTANPLNDRVFEPASELRGSRQLISIGGLPFMVETKRDKAKVFFLAGQDVADLNADPGDSPYTEYFSRLLPYCMVLRHVFGEESWHPRTQLASVIVDDPPLWRNYGFLNFDHLLTLLEEHRFHACIAFIPHNFRRSSAAIVRSALKHADRFSICFHGNDHTDGELASTDSVLLNTLLRVAEQRMDTHLRSTGLHCDRVMVFPQGKFSTQAMAVLKSRNFEAAINTVAFPVHKPIRLTLGDLAQPAILRYEGFPLFLRQDSLHTQLSDIAFKLFFGRPVFIVEHHQIFREPASLVLAVSRVNATAPEVRWSSPGCAVRNVLLWRRAADGTYGIRAYSRTISVSNASSSVVRVRIEWTGEDGGVAPRQVLQDGVPCEFETGDSTIAITAALRAKGLHTFTLVHVNNHRSMNGLGFRRTIHAFLRRRLSEVRDNHLSRNQQLLRAAEVLQKRLLR